MEKRVAKVNFSAAGGNASAGSVTCKVTLPTSWLNELGVTREDRQVILTLDANQIRISRYPSMDEFTERAKAAGHNLISLRYYDGDTLCSTILADYTAQSLVVENYTEELVKTAFGKRRFPSWDDFLAFLEERCIPRSRSGLREYLEAIGLTEYDPLQIILKTKGRMAEDQQWLEVEVLS